MRASCAMYPKERPDAESLSFFCQERRKEAGEIKYPSELVWVDPLPGEDITTDWRIAPKFKLAHEELDYGDQVAEGGFSEIFRGTYKGRPVAIKKLKVWLLGEETLVEFQKEAEVSSGVPHFWRTKGFDPHETGPCVIVPSKHFDHDWNHHIPVAVHCYALGRS